MLAVLVWSTGCANQGSEITPSNATSPVSKSAATPTGTTTSPNASGATSPTATGPTSASSSATGVPPAAQVDSAEGAAEFVRFAVARVNLSYRSADSAILDSVFARTGCPGCDFIRRDVGELAANRQKAASDLLTTRLVMPNTWEPGKATVELRVHQERTDIIDEIGRRVDFYRDGDFRYLVTLARGHSWLIVRWQGIAS